eukprot:3524564-Rhodomonas_salina.2
MCGTEKVYGAAAVYVAVRGTEIAYGPTGVASHPKSHHPLSGVHEEGPVAPYALARPILVLT